MKYNTNYDPPALTANITLRNLTTNEELKEIEVILDTGADVTLLPIDLCKLLNADISSSESLNLNAFDNTPVQAFFVKTEIIFLDKSFRGNFLAYEGNEVIIGRNILNEFSILMDGPNLQWDTLDT